MSPVSIYRRSLITAGSQDPEFHFPPVSNYFVRAINNKQGAVFGLTLLQGLGDEEEKKNVKLVIRSTIVVRLGA